MPRKIDVKKVKINACRNATNNSKKLRAMTPKTLTDGHAPKQSRALIFHHDNEHQDGSEHHVTGKHIGKKTYAQHDALDDVANRSPVPR